MKTDTSFPEWHGANMPQPPGLDCEPEPEDGSCQGCGGEPAPHEHTCPYAEELANSKALCNCCDECQHQCAMDI